eukprot:TRINITY_DN6010_c0_g1_i2.p1 TRINITY_DN6010_c0_g1~~TRINITY_DN6010_c0_g1_i2.p1  ORF type:complete len:754 (-),score=210.62 TRINITY_DN6010_c0_g1_i2:256-2301(-)
MEDSDPQHPDRKEAVFELPVPPASHLFHSPLAKTTVQIITPQLMKENFDLLNRIYEQEESGNVASFKVIEPHLIPSKTRLDRSEGEEEGEEDDAFVGMEQRDYLKQSEDGRLEFLGNPKILKEDDTIILFPEDRERLRNHKDAVSALDRTFEESLRRRLDLFEKDKLVSEDIGRLKKPLKKKEKDALGRVNRRDWQLRVYEKHPVLYDLSSRAHPVRRSALFSAYFGAGKSGVKEILTDSTILQLIMQHLQASGCQATRKSLEEESGIRFMPHNFDESILLGHLRRAMWLSDQVYLQVIGDRIGTSRARLYNLLFDLGFEETQEDSEVDVSVWDEPIGSVIRDEKTGVIDAATLNGLVIEITNPEYVDVNMLKAFLMTFQSFTTPDRLVTKLVQRYNVPPTHKDVESQIHFRVINVIKKWVDESLFQFHRRVLSRLIDFLENTVKQTQGGKGLGISPLQLIAKLQSGESTRSEIAHVEDPPAPKIPKSIFSPELDLFDIDEEEVARQLTLVQHDLLKRISPSEFFDQAWTKPKLRHRCANLIQFIQYFDRVHLYFCSMIVGGETVEIRRSRYISCVKLAQHLRRLNNFSGFLILILALFHMSVTRLAKTRSGLPRNIMDILMDLEKYYDASGKCKLITEELLKSTPPAIPVLSGYQTDLIHIDTSHKNFVERGGKKADQLV